MMKQQDEGLELLGQSADRLSKISMGIHEELGHQNKWVLDYDDCALCYRLCYCMILLPGGDDTEL